jgi:nucleoside-diphosphate-sugar epimerase
MSRLFITGADGFTGVHLVNLAKKNSYEVYESKALLTDIVALKTEINSFKPEYVVHLAAISSTVSNHFNEIYETNLIGTLNLLNLLNIEGVKPKKVLLASSAQVYGNQGEKPFTEDSQLAPFNHYGVSKMSMEYMASQFFNSFPIVFLRPFNYTGVGHNAHFVIPKIVNHFKDKVESIELGNLDVKREYNDVRTVCRIYLDLLNKGISGEAYNICSGKTYSLREILLVLENISKRRLDVTQNPQFMRPNEPTHLSGDPSKLVKTLGEIDFIPIEKTLEWMLHS